MTEATLVLRRGSVTSTSGSPSLVDAVSQTSGSPFSLWSKVTPLPEELRVPIVSDNILLRIGHNRHIILNVEMDEVDEFVVSHPRIHVYGVGQTVPDAVKDFVSMLIDLHKELRDSEDILSRHLLEQFNFIRSVLSDR